MKEGWEYRKLGECCITTNNIRWTEDEPMHQYIDLSSVDRETSLISNTESVNIDNAPSRAKQIIKIGDVIFATTRPTLKRVAVIDEKYDGEICSTGFCVLRPISDLLDTRFLFNLLKADDFYKYIEPLQTGASYPAVTDRIVKNYVIPVPPLSEQQRIVTYLDSSFSKIDELKENVAKELSDAKALFQAELKKCMEKKEGWEEKKLKYLSEIYGNYGLSVSSVPYNGVRYLRITDITEWGELNNEYVSADVDSSTQEKLEEGDILFARTGATVGKTLVYKEEFGDCLFAGYLIRYRLKRNLILPRFMHYVTHSAEYYKWIASNQKAAAQPNISAKLYNEYLVNFPTIDEQNLIVKKLDSLFSKVQQLEANYSKVIAECDALKQAILRETFE